MISRGEALRIVGSLALLAPGPALAETAVAEPTPSVRIPRLGAPPTLEDFASMRPASDVARRMARIDGFRQNTPRDGNRVEHVVASGDSFWSISRRYNVNMNKLAAWNGMAPRDTLSVGQKLVVWTSQPVPTKAGVGSGTTRKLNYTVRSGDSLYLIASCFRVTVSQLVRWNNIDKNKILRPGQKLTMYVDVTAQSS